MSIKIINYKEEYKKDLKKMKIGLHKFLMDIDTWKVLKLDQDYKKRATDALLKNIKESKGKIFLAKSGDDFVGYVAGLVFQNKEDFETYPLKRGYVDELYIDEKYRGKGVGKELLAKMEKYFRSKNCDTIGLNAMIMNKKAIGLYEKIGFEERSVFLSKALNKKVKKSKINNQYKPRQGWREAFAKANIIEK